MFANDRTQRQYVLPAVCQLSGLRASRLGTAVGGPAIGRLIDCVGDGGTAVNYGLLSGKACEINAFNFVFRDITLTGFWLAKLLGSMSFEQIQAMYAELAGRLIDGTIHVNIDSNHPLTRISDAMAHAKRESRGGKVQLRPNG